MAILRVSFTLLEFYSTRYHIHPAAKKKEELDPLQPLYNYQLSDQSILVIKKRKHTNSLRDKGILSLTVDVEHFEDLLCKQFITVVVEQNASIQNLLDKVVMYVMKVDVVYRCREGNISISKEQLLDYAILVPKLGKGIFIEDMELRVSDIELENTVRSE